MATGYACVDKNGKIKVDIVDRLEAEVESLRVMLRECADDLESEVEGRYASVKDHPAMAPKYERDMDSVRRARLLLESRPVESSQRGRSE